MNKKEITNGGNTPVQRLWVYWAASVLALLSLAAVIYFLPGLKGSGEERSSVSEEAAEAGLAEAAREAKAQFSIPPGAGVCAAAELFAASWQGRHLEISDTREGLKAQVEKGLCDYVVIDSFWVRRNAPDLKMLVTESDPLPGAGLVYRKYFREHDKLISVLKRGEGPLKLDLSITGDNEYRLLQRAAEAAENGYVEHARQIYHGLAQAFPKNEVYHHELVKIYIIYGYFDGVSLDRAEDELMRYAFLNPGTSVKEYNEIIQTIRTLHQAQWGGQ